VSDRAARTVLALVIALLAGAAASARIPFFWSDGATYHGMAWSLAEDGDLQYEARDVYRTRREFPTGPQGIFLKRASGGWEIAPEAGFPWLRRVPAMDPRIYYAKAFAYPVAVAPLVKLFGTRGLLLANAAFLGLALALGYAELRRRTTPGRALVATLALFIGTVTPLYLFWPQPEIFNLALITAGLVAWRRDRPRLAAVLLGIATYSKPYNLLLGLPLGVEPLIAGRRQWVRGLLESVRRGAVLGLTVGVLFGINRLITGEMNYQGGERKTFYGTLPFEAHGVTFGNSGQWMTTDQLGPLVEGRDDATRRTGPARPASEYRQAFVRNLGYFWVGRFGGALPYFAPVVFALLAFLLVGPRDRAGWLALAALVVSWLFYIWMIPDNWYGGGGTVGNRYFLNLVPLALFLLPRGREWLVAVPGLVVSAVLLWPVWRAPLAHSLRPGDHATGGGLRAFPPELTMLNDLSLFTEPWRKKQPYGDTEGDAHRNWPADTKAYYLYFLDEGTEGRQSRDGVEGFAIEPGARTEVILRSLEPVRKVTVELRAEGAGGRVRVDAGGQTRTADVPVAGAAAVEFEPGAGFQHYDSFLHSMEFASEAPGRVFVRIGLEVNRRPRSGQ
jgi:glycosyl transferase family 87